MHWIVYILIFVSFAAPADELRGLIERSCADCHDADTRKGGLDLLSLKLELNEAANRERWIQIHDRIQKKEMPPKAEKLPAPQREQMLRILGEKMHQADAADIRANGRGPLRRLTRDEYEATLRDLLRLPHLDVRDRLPEDRRSHGFSKVSALLDMSHVQLNAYLDAAETALLKAVASGEKPPKQIQYRATGTDLFPALTTFGEREAMFFARNGKAVGIKNAEHAKWKPEQRKDPTLELALFRSATWPYYGYPRNFRAPRDGEYRVRFSGRAVRQLKNFQIVPASRPLAMSFRARKTSGPDVSGDVRETGGWIDLQPAKEEFETTVILKKGETFEYSLLGLPVPFIRTDGGFFYKYPPMPPDGHRGAAFQRLEVEGPLTENKWPPRSHRVLFDELPIGPPAKSSQLSVSVVASNPVPDAKRLMRRFAKRFAKSEVRELGAYDRLIAERLKAGMPFADAMLKGYQAFLCSGHFLYLREPADTRSTHIRMAALFWNSVPEGKADPKRMLADPRSQRFINTFTDEWLDLRHLGRDEADIRQYPEYRRDDYLVASLGRETRAFFTTLIRENLSITNLVDSDFSFVNDKLAAHYGLPPIHGSALHRMKLPVNSPYGGLLTQGAIMKVTADGTSTSPILRGAWVMEKLLGDPPPPPPKSVPGIEPDVRGATTIREILARHAKDESCAACHARFDPVGFALENFDVMGAWRLRYRSWSEGAKVTGVDRAGHPYQYHLAGEINAAGRLLSGESFKDVLELKKLLAAKPRQLARNFIQQLTLYATGTPVRFSERSAVEQILDRCADRHYPMRDLIEEFVASSIFAKPTNE